MSPAMEVLVGLVKNGASIEEAFRKAAVVSAFPLAGPNGESDLEFRYRKGTSAEGKPYEYYSVVCASAGQEFKFGQRQDGSGLFPKGWEALYNAQEGGAQAGNGVIGASAPQPQVQAAPVPTPQPQSVAQPQPAQSAPAVQAPAPAPAAQNNNQSIGNSVLAKYGIGGQ